MYFLPVVATILYPNTEKFNIGYSIYIVDVILWFYIENECINHELVAIKNQWRNGIYFIAVTIELNLKWYYTLLFYLILGNIDIKYVPANYESVASIFDNNGDD